MNRIDFAARARALASRPDIDAAHPASSAESAASEEMCNRSRTMAAIIDGEVTK